MLELKIKELADNFFSRFLKADKRIKIFIVIGIIGIILILLSEVVPSGEKPKSDPQDKNISYGDYIASLEEQTSDLLSSIDGAGRCKVMITLKDTNENVYAKNSEENNDESSYSKSYEYVLYDGQDGEAPILIKQYYPAVQGVAVVCDGADNKVVRESIINTVSSLYNVSVSKISVSKYKG